MPRKDPPNVAQPTNPAPLSPAAEPVDIRYNQRAQQLEITWSDGHESRYGYEFLRWACPCAACAGEMGVAGRLADVMELRPEETELRQLELVGTYAIRPTWANGHDSGIYSFDHLHRLCRCAACTTGRG